VKEMHEFINPVRKNSERSINHVYQEDDGFRKTRILNSAIKKANTGYLIFIDGDCIPHSSFTNEHITQRDEGTVLCGRRVNLSKKFSDKITVDRIISGEAEKVNFSHVLDSWRSKSVRSTHIEEGFFITNNALRTFISKGKPRIIGCNFSIYKSMMEKINGFDENYTGPGFGEDTDIEYRLRLAGYKLKSVRNRAVLFHLHHKRTVESHKSAVYFEEVRQRNDFVCKNGLVKLA
jgi:GT2 family glycosyltransferase